MTTRKGFLFWGDTLAYELLAASVGAAQNTNSSGTDRLAELCREIQTFRHCLFSGIFDAMI